MSNLSIFIAISFGLFFNVAQADSSRFEFVDQATKAWTAEEKRVVVASIEELGRSPLGLQLLNRIGRERATIKLMRGTTSSESPDALASTEVVKSEITFWDSSFNSIDRAMVEVVTHELAHVFDCLPSNLDKNWSCLNNQKSFRRAMRLRWITFASGTPREYQRLLPEGYDASTYETLVTKFRTLRESGSLKEALRLRATYLKSLHVPTGYSLSDPVELYAESLMAIILETPGRANLRREATRLLTSQLTSQP